MTLPSDRQGFGTWWSTIWLLQRTLKHCYWHSFIFGFFRWVASSTELASSAYCSSLLLLFFSHCIWSLPTLCPNSSRLSLPQIRRHGAKDDCREDLRLHLLPERCAGDRSARPCYCLQLQSHLPPEPEGRQTPCSEGKSPLRQSPPVLPQGEFGVVCSVC